jgi:hypothetical protein
VDYSLCPTKNLVAYNKPPYEQQNSPLEMYSNSSLQAKSLPKSTSKSSKYTYLAPYAHLASMKLSKIKVPTIHHMNVKLHKTHYKKVASKQNVSKTCLSYDPLLSWIPSREFAKEVKSVEHVHNGLVTSNPKNLDPRAQFSNERFPKNMHCHYLQLPWPFMILNQLILALQINQGHHMKLILNIH